MITALSGYTVQELIAAAINQPTAVAASVGAPSMAAQTKSTADAAPSSGAMHTDEDNCTDDARHSTGILNHDQEGTSAGDALHTDPNEVSDPLIDVTVMAAGSTGDALEVQAQHYEDISQDVEMITGCTDDALRVQQWQLRLAQYEASL